MSSRAHLAVAAVPLVLVPALGAVQGGYLPDAWVWATPLAAWGAAVGAVVWGGGALRDSWPWLAATLALLAWTAASWLWSANRGQSVLEVRRTALYAAIVLALLALAGRRAASVLALATCAAVAALVLYALARYLIGARQYSAFEGTLLAQPLGYANAVGILAALALLLATGVAAHARPQAARMAAAGVLPPLALALSLSASRGGWVALACGAAIAVSLGDGGAVLRALLLAAPGAVGLVALGAWLGLANAAVSAPRSDGIVLAAVAVVVAATTAFAAGRLGPWRPSVPRRVAALALLAAVALAGVAFERAATVPPRASYWHVAWHSEVSAHPLLGTGAGTFGHYWMRSPLAARTGGALDAHSLYLETLGELGPAGLALLLAVLILPVLGLRRARSGAYTPAAAAAWVAFLVHAGLDWDWELPAVVAAALACAAALLLGDADDAPEPLPTRARTAAVAAALVLGGIGIAGTTSDAVPTALAGTASLRRQRLP